MKQKITTLHSKGGEFQVVPGHERNRWAILLVLLVPVLIAAFVALKPKPQIEVERQVPQTETRHLDEDGVTRTYYGDTGN